MPSPLLENSSAIKSFFNHFGIWNVSAVFLSAILFVFNLLFFEGFGIGGKVVGGTYEYDGMEARNGVLIQIIYMVVGIGFGIYWDMFPLFAGIVFILPFFLIPRTVARKWFTASLLIWISLSGTIMMLFFGYLNWFVYTQSRGSMPPVEWVLNNEKGIVWLLNFLPMTWVKNGGTFSVLVPYSLALALPVTLCLALALRWFERRTLPPELGE